jgi:energy-coupling factor transport system ATP-binding protein
VYKNEIIGLFGKSGSGKSTFAHLLKGLIKPTRGNVTICGKKTSDEKLCHEVGIVFQHPENQLFEENVLKDVMFGLKNLGFDENISEKKALESLKNVGFNEKKIYDSPFEISGGEKRLAAIAGVIVMEPEILILDEPTAGLDIFAKYSFLDFLFLMHKKQNSTIIFISHFYEEIELISDRILTFKNGNLLQIN